MSDRKYFGDQLRKERVVPISVENPNEHEIRDEGKGFLPPDNRELSPQALHIARNAVLKRRLLDGDLALERYDLSRSADASRAIQILESLIPKGSNGPSLVWLWVNGPLDPQGTTGKDACSYVDAFRKQLARANIELARLRLFSKPNIELAAGIDGKKDLDSAIVRFRNLDLWLSVNLSTAGLEELVGR